MKKHVNQFGDAFCNGIEKLLETRKEKELLYWIWFGIWNHLVVIGETKPLMQV